MNRGEHIEKRGSGIRTLRNFKIQHNCRDCKLRSAGFFCDLSQPSLEAFESLKITNTYPKGAAIFSEGQPANGIYMLCHGRVKLSTCSRDGKVIILRVAEPGEVLGLSAIVSGSNYEATAEVLEPCQVNFVGKEDFLRLIARDPEACYSAIKQLSRKYQTAYTQVRSFGLSHTAADKLAKLLLEWVGGCGNGNKNVDIHLKLAYTHEEISEMIGTSRETVTRILKDFRDRKLIILKGSDLTIPDPGRLDATIGVRIKAEL
jgi:CRP/FNR family transcriptional regulator, cyclic AMP receptor protein